VGINGSPTKFFWLLFLLQCSKYDRTTRRYLPPRFQPKFIFDVIGWEREVVKPSLFVFDRSKHEQGRYSLPHHTLVPFQAHEEAFCFVDPHPSLQTDGEDDTWARERVISSVHTKLSGRVFYIYLILSLFSYHSM
jgi:hypothetical protein